MNITEDSYVVQPNVISRAVYIMPTMARRLIFLAVFNVQVDRPNEMKFEIDLRELALQFGFVETKRYDELKAAIDIASKQILRFETEGGGITEWMPWLTYCSLNLKNNLVTIQINEHLHDYVLNIRQSTGFSILLLSDYFKLESRYAYRWFEIIFSRCGHSIKGGPFFVRYSVEEIKTLFLIDDKKYKNKKDFRLYVIERPIDEINEKKIGFTVIPEYVYKGKKLIDVILRCSFSKRDNGSDLMAYYMSRYPKEFFNYFSEAKRSPELRKYKNSESFELKCMQKALELLNTRFPHE